MHLLHESFCGSYKFKSAAKFCHRSPVQSWTGSIPKINLSAVFCRSERPDEGGSERFENTISQYQLKLLVFSVNVL